MRRLVRAKRRKPCRCRQGPDERRVDVAATVALSSGREHRVRSEQHAAADPSRQVHAEERIAWVGHRVDEPAHEMAGRGHETVVLAPEGDDRRVRAVAREHREAIRMQTPGDHDPIGDDMATVRGTDLDVAAALVEPGHLEAGDDLGAALTGVGDHGGGDEREVGDGGRGGVQGRAPDDVRLELSQRRALEPAQAGHAVRPRSGLEVPQPAVFDRVERDDELAELLVGQPAVVAVGPKAAQPLARQGCLGRTRRVVETGVHDAAVVRRLVPAGRELFLDEGDLRSRVEQGQATGDGRTDDAATDDDEPRSAHPATVRAASSAASMSVGVGAATWAAYGSGSRRR